VAWLGLLAQAPSQSGPIGLQAALAAGLYPFILADLLKVLAAGSVMPAVWKVVGK
jgi:biotin transporter BioY